MSDDHLTRQDEDLSAPELAAEDRQDGHDFGNWPELLGLALTALLIWLTFAFTG
ncbi:hypothetical protein [Salipiger bermudensis]|uniref:Uncharacterized protein n=1 Tax=Salipiger bermudensis (strain DSM 26914 / JCM 13377 / KCTC 12554 / HTCC2601) TaxID=314265 RepID=Q0FPN7_SALBH|nr:hypothetical protein [Salipiger bermudensis]EAU46176.1 hypothetical protein R2601_01723 [Salipiger bermudensis HTCC2601]